MSEISVTTLLPLIRRAGKLLAESYEGLGHLSCGEIQGVVDLLIAAGMDDMATEVVHSHGASGDDDESDLHHRIYLAAEDGSGDDPEELARTWVAELKAGYPLRRFRFTLTDGRVLAETTREGRDDAAQRVWADVYGMASTGESWTPEDGWQQDATFTPRPD